MDIPLAKHGFRQLTGIDRSGYLTRLARKRAKQAGLDVLLAEAGFTELRFQEVIEGQSDRGADLGMMARRLLLICRAPRKVASKGGDKPQIRDLTVLLGDPRLPDSVKLEGNFNADDLATVVRLKAALAEIPGLRISYLDHHASLLADQRSDVR